MGPLHAGRGVGHADHVGVHRALLRVRHRRTRLGGRLGGTESGPLAAIIGAQTGHHIPVICQLALLTKQHLNG